MGRKYILFLVGFLVLALAYAVHAQDADPDTRTASDVSEDPAETASNAALILGSAETSSPPALTETSSRAALMLSTPSGAAGDEAEMSVSLVRNKGIAGFVLNIMYDDAVLTPLRVDADEHLGGTIFTFDTDTEKDPSGLSRMTVAWASEMDSVAVDLFTIRFKISDNAPEGQSPVTLSVAELVSLNGEDVFADINNGFVEVLPGLLWGDVNEDGVVDIRSLVRLAQHLAEIPDEMLSGQGLLLADVNRDEQITLADFILLARYLVGSEGIILGVAQ